MYVCKEEMLAARLVLMFVLGDWRPGYVSPDGLSVAESTSFSLYVWMSSSEMPVKLWMSCYGLVS